MAHNVGGKDFVEFDNPTMSACRYSSAKTRLSRGLDCDVLLQLGADFAWPQFYPTKAENHSESTLIRSMSAAGHP